jgi:hypothetical protein
MSNDMQLLRNDRVSDPVIVDDTDEDRLDAPGVIRCPQCGWQPANDSRWSCVWEAGVPEPWFPACGTVWNTFATKGCCPGCRHQWKWTSCLRCEGWSPHDDWYDEGA